MATRSFFGWKPLSIPGLPKVSLAIASYGSPNTLGSLLYALKSQTYENWEAIVVHDGAGPEARALIEKIGEPRIKLIETEERRGAWGHPWRERGIEACTGDFIGLTNDDNWYAPTYFEWMLHELLRERADFVFCNMVHSHHRWKYFPTRPKKGCLDLGGWIGRAELVKSTPWTDHSFDGDGTFIEALVRKSRRVARVDGCLFVHN